MKTMRTSALAALLIASALAAPAYADPRPEPFAGDVVNESAIKLLIWGDNVLGPGVNYGCLPANSSTHNMQGAVDVDFVYSWAAKQWCKIGAGEAKLRADGTWICPEGWSKPDFLRYDLTCP